MLLPKLWIRSILYTEMAEFPKFQFNKSTDFIHKLDLTAVWPLTLDDQEKKIPTIDKVGEK